MRHLIAFSLCSAVLAGAALADGPPLGCYLRVYQDTHLKQNPAQIVEALQLRVYVQPEYGETVADMKVLFANQGHVAASGHGGQTLEQFLLCWGEGAETGCSVECDGGSLKVTKLTDETMTIETDYLLVGDVEECGGSVDLVEAPNQPVRYRLNKVADSVCLDN